MTGVVVIKLSGRPIDEPGAFASLWAELARTADVTRLVIVHGGGLAVDRRLASVGAVSQKVGGLRVTPADHIGHVASVLAGEVNRALVGALTAAGADVVGLGLSDAGLCSCEAVEGLGRVGRVIGGDGGLVEALHRAGLVPVVHSIGMGADGALLNVNADDAAAGVAAACNAERLVLLTDVPGVLDAAGVVLGELEGEMVEEMIASGVVGGGMAAKVRAAERAAGACGARVVIGSWEQAGALIAGTIGVGTVVRARRREAGVEG